MESGFLGNVNTKPFSKSAVGSAMRASLTTSREENLQQVGAKSDIHLLIAD
jgi:hypothetical protein